MPIKDLTLIFPNKRFLSNGFEFTEGENNINSRYDDGTVFKRRKTTSAPMDIVASLMLSTTELGLLRNFYNVDCKSGTKSFYFFNPFEASLLVKTKMYFLIAPTYTAFSSSYWTASLSIRVFENDTL